MEKNNPGKIIDQAYKIIFRTFQETNSLKNDFFNLLKEIDTAIEYDEEHSYATKYLYLKEQHTYLFKKKDEEEDTDYEHIIGMTILFSKSGEYKKVSSADGPELWVCVMDTKNIDGKTRPWHIANCLKLEDRKYFIEKNLEIGGKVYNYHWKEDATKKNCEEWDGQFIGYPLTEIKDCESIKIKIIDKLDFQS